MKRETPYPQKRQPAKRISLKKHETIVHQLNMTILQLKNDLHNQSESCRGAWHTANKFRDMQNNSVQEVERLNAIINKLVGYEQS